VNEGGNKMKAVVATRGGPPDVLQLREVDKPAPRAGEALIHVRAATVTTGDVVLRKLPRLMALPMRLMGVRRKATPGHEFAGDVEAVGEGVARFAAGDAVFGTTTGLSVGANAEYVCLPADGVLAAIPDGVSYEGAAALPVGGMTALHFLRQGDIQNREKALIYGASGSVGSYAVQLARHFGAEVTGVCSTANVEMVKSLGADHVVDYKKEDFTASGAQYDLIFDAVGKTSRSDCAAALAPDGAFVTVQKGVASESADDLAFLAGLVATGELSPVIDRRYPLEGIAEAHRYVETGRKQGNVVITVGDADQT
jgi:NADPH:quinone reductase-like Zn-dependent oxidoreductase